MHLIPQSWAHFHILVTVFPSIGLVFALGLYVAGMLSGNEGIKRISIGLFVILGILAVPVYISGEHAMELLADDPKVAKNFLDLHYGWGIASLVALAVTGLVALIVLVRSPRKGQITENALHLVLGLAIITLA